MKFRKILAIGIGFSLIGAQALTVSADTSDDIAAVQQAQASANAELSTLQGQIDDMETQKSALLAQIDGYDKELVTTMVAISSLDDQINSAQENLEQTGKDLEKAEADAQNEYDAMKQRIQYLYEQGGEDGWVNVMLGDATLSQGIDKVDFTTSLYEYDRNELTEYEATVNQVTELKAQQVNQKSQLETMKREEIEAKDTLESLKAAAQAESDDYETQIANAEAAANEYYALIASQNEKIAELQAQQAAAQTALEAQTVASASADTGSSSGTDSAEGDTAVQEDTSVYTDDSSTYTDSTYTDSTSDDTYSYTDDTVYDSTDSGLDYTGEQAEQAAATQEAIDNGLETVDTTAEAGSTATGSATGEAIAAYALQFVGNPYVWGGTSLTSGCDCSGFVQSVFAAFGISVSRTTYTQACEGVEVSYSDMQPGDVINYGFHTSIYIGNNMIVHAADESLGIITQSNPAFEPIVTIRRFY